MGNNAGTRSGRASTPNRGAPRTRHACVTADPVNTQRHASNSAFLVEKPSSDKTPIPRRSDRWRIMSITSWEARTLGGMVVSFIRGMTRLSPSRGE